MPLGIERINARRTQPNSRITFIRPLETKDQAEAQDFLQRLAASVVPIMKRNHLSVMALCDFPANDEFLGRNFNSGERIDLVLKSKTGQWYPFKFVQGVLIHELAHIMQMNHSKAFWKVRQQYHDELKVLWSKNYTGEGLWGKGVALYSGQYEGDSLADGQDLPARLCGGTYRSSRKRKPKPKLSYKEQKERRIVKKFGRNGMALGADEDTKANLENGKRPKGKPRVAGSNRGRELRAAAALARFEVKVEEPVVKEEVDAGSETEDDEEYEASDALADEAIDIDGTKLLDNKGHGVIKVCEDEDQDDVEVQNEMAELQGLKGRKSVQVHPDRNLPSSTPGQWVKHEEVIGQSLSAIPPTPGMISAAFGTVSKAACGETIANDDDTSTASEDDGLPALNAPPKTISASTVAERSTIGCPVCSVENDARAPTCQVCANVLDTGKVPGVWKCSSDVCRDSVYLNCEDVGICGVCGTRKHNIGD